MMTLPRRRSSSIPAFALLAALLAPPAAPGQEKKIPPAAEGEVDFARDIQPIIAKHCIKCHGPDEQESGFRLDSREAALKGGDVGKGIVPGKSAESPLIRYVSGVDKEITMPPEGEGEPLNPKQIGLLRAWIDQGVKWAEGAPQAGKTGGPPLRPLKGQTKWVTALAFDPSWKSLATAGGETLLFKP
ncbi:MAG: c-type cytochrome domain-containing protein, partial [Thermoanaerobaculia bacterium]